MSLKDDYASCSLTHHKLKHVHAPDDKFFAGVNLLHAFILLGL